jgi:hypothetical protein
MRTRGLAGRTPLVCLPFAGSGASFYRAWRKLEAVPVEVIPLQLPGREERFTEALPTDLITTAKDLARDVVRASAGKGPVALLGHSLGAALGYEVVRQPVGDVNHVLGKAGGSRTRRHRAGAWLRPTGSRGRPARRCSPRRFPAGSSGVPVYRRSSGSVATRSTLGAASPVAGTLSWPERHHR